MRIDPSALENLQVLLLGFAFAGLLASAFELFTARRASFSLLSKGGVLAVACLPILALSAPFIILRNTVRGRRIEGRPVVFVTLATVLAGGWSLASGHLVLAVAHSLAGS